MNTPDSSLAGAKVDALLASETGRRHLVGAWAKLALVLMLSWSLFQLWYASPLPFTLGFGAFNEDQARFIHLSFALSLAFCLFPASVRSPVSRPSVLDSVLLLCGVSACLYLFFWRDELALRMGAPSSLDVVLALLGMACLLEATRRALGLPLLIVAIIFIGFTLFGQWMPEVIAHKGASLNKLASHQWLTTEGVFGVALGVSTSFVFLFVLLGALLDKAGAGNYLIQTSYALMGHLRGGPAKAAVVASGLSGVISGSSIANVVTTGTFTIPLMKRVGFPAPKAGAVEVAASTNGQLTPPIMGAAAFLMVEYVGISYIEVVKHAILPALISYIALLYIVHLEAIKLNIQGIARTQHPTLAQRLSIWVLNILLLLLLAGAVYYGTQWLEAWLGEAAAIAMSLCVLAAYLWLLRLAARYPDLPARPYDETAPGLPPVRPTVLSGLYFVVPIVVLLWALAVKRYSPQQSAFYAILFLLFVVLTHRPLKAWFRGDQAWTSQWRVCREDLLHGLLAGARNMIGIGIATAAAGIVVGTVTLTGLGQMMTEFVDFISGGHLLLMLIFTALICIILGMGLPTTANYIVVATLMAPVIVTLGAESGLVVPLIAVHMFVFYFGILADDTPPVGLAAYAAAAIASADPIRTGIQGFAYDIRTAILPFMFIFNPQLLLIGIESWFELLLTVSSAVVAILIFSAATQGYWLVKSRRWESAVLILLAFSLFRPGYWMDALYPPYQSVPPTALEEQVMNMQAGEYLHLQVAGTTLDGEWVEKTVALQLQEDASDLASRLRGMGLLLSDQPEPWRVDLVLFDSQAQKAGIDAGWQVSGVQIMLPRPAKEWMFIPALLLLAGLAGWQLRRRKQSLREPGLQT